MSTLRILGEFGLIAHLERFAGDGGPDVLLGMGDDAAAFRGDASLCWLATCDAQIEGVHFLMHRSEPKTLGQRIAAVNLSDIAAMGGMPRYAFLALRVHQEMRLSWIDALYQGLQSELSREGAVILGGNTARTGDGVSVDLFLLGQVAQEEMLLRSAVKPGDKLCVTGTLGDSRAGLFLLEHAELPVSPEARAYCQQRHHKPTARVAVGRFLSTSGRVRACIDISDGLVQDAGHLARRSAVTLRIDTARLPLHDATRDAAAHAGEAALKWALTGGEDYELLFSVPAGDAEDIAAQCLAQTGVPVTIVGEAVTGTPDVVLTGTCAPTLSQKGFDHLQGGEMGGDV